MAWGINSKMKTVAVAIAAVLMLSTAHSSVIRVPTDFKTIQAAIVKAKDGDTIRVFSGTYLGPISITKSLVLIGSGDTAMTAIVALNDSATTEIYTHLL